MSHLVQPKTVDMGWYIECNSLEDACRKIFRISRIVAMFPLSDDCRFSLKFSIFPSICLFLLSIHSVYWVFNVEKVLREYNVVIYILYLHMFRKLSMTFSCVLIVSQLVSKRGKIRLILNDLKLIDSELALLHKGTNLSINPFKYLFNIFLSLCLVFLQLTGKPAFYWMQEHIETILLAAFINQIFAFCDLLKYSLEQISVFHSFEKNTNFTIRTRIYNLIEDCTKNLNDSYGTGMFFIIITLSITILHQFYQCLNKTLTRTPSILNAVLTISGDLWFLVQLILAGNGVTSKATKFNVTLYNELMKLESKNIPNIEEIYFHFEQVKEFRWTANRVFSVDKKLISSMIITGTTYLVILLQYT